MARSALQYSDDDYAGEEYSPPPAPAPAPAPTPTSVDIPMRFKGAMGGAAVGDDYPDHEPRLPVPFERYKELENTDPKLYEAITHVAKAQRVPPADLAAIVYASSENRYNARDGDRVGYAGLTSDDVQQLDPNGQMDINNPVDNLFLGAAKYKALSRRFGEGTPHTFAAYHGGPDTVDTLLSRHPDEHRSAAPPGMFEFVNRVAGRGPEGEGSGGGTSAREDTGAGGDGTTTGSGSSVEEMARQAAGQPPERFVPGSQPVAPMYPSQVGDRGASAPIPPVPVDRGASVPIPPPLDRGASAPIPIGPVGEDYGAGGLDQGPRRGAERGAPLYDAQDPAELERRRGNWDRPLYRVVPEILGSGNLGGFVPPTSYGAGAAGPAMSRDTPFTPAGGAAAVPPDVAAALPTGAPPPSMPVPGAPYDQAYGGARPMGDYSGGDEVGPLRPPTPPAAAGAGAGATRPPPSAALARTPPPSTDNMAAELNRQELARIQAGRPDIPPTGPTQALAGAPPPPSAAPAPDQQQFAPLLAAVAKQYPALAPFMANVKIQAGTGLDFYQPNDERNPNPGSITLAINPELLKDPAALLSDPRVTTALGQMQASLTGGASPGAATLAPVGTTGGPSPGATALAPVGTVPATTAPTTGSGVPAPPAPAPGGAASATPGAAPAGGAAAPAGAGGVAGTAGQVAGGRAALAAPGSPPAPDIKPPIDRLNGSPGSMTPRGFVRAVADGGTDGALTYVSRGAPRGMSMGDSWNRVEDSLAKAFMIKGDMQGAMHAQEYVFRLKHKGAMENLMQSIGAFESGDMNAAAQYAAKSHAFVTDGTVMGFQPTANGLWAQRFDEQTHDKLGAPFQVTGHGLRAQAMANSSPEHFFANMHNEMTAVETQRHNKQSESHQERALTETVKDREQRLKERQLEYDTTESRHRDLMKQQDDRARDLQADRLEAQQQRAHEAALAKQQAADAREKERQERAADAREKDQQRLAQVRDSHRKAVAEETTELYGSGGIPGNAINPDNNKPYEGEQLTKARRMFNGIRAENPHIDKDSAADYAANIVNGKYTLHEDDKGYVDVWDENGKALVSVPRGVWRAYLPSQKVLPPGARVPQAAPVR